MGRSVCLSLLFALVPLSQGLTQSLEGADTGNWTVGDCILAQFAMEFQIHPDPKDRNKTFTLEVPQDAQVTDKSNCGDGKEGPQRLSLSWRGPAQNDSSVLLNRTISITFAQKPNDTYYGVSRLYAVFGIWEWNENGTNMSSAVAIDTDELSNLMFHTPLERSYLCADVGHWEINSALKYLDGPPTGIKLANSTVTAKRVQFDAFRTTGRAPPGFRTPMDCDYKPNDIVPIAVGVALAFLVIVVLIAYLVGRRRHRQRGYQSV